MIYLQAAVAGALTGGLFAVMAVGMSLTWGMLRVINLAHFGLILLGAYLTFQLATGLGIDPILTLVVSAPVLFAVGALMQLAFDRLGLTEFNSLIVSFGLLIIIVQLTSNVWSADFQRMDSDVNPYATEAVTIGPLAFPVPTLLAFVAAVLVVGAAHLGLTRTYPGRALRAFAQDRAIAAAFGIDHVRLGTLLAGLSGATAATAGMLFALGNAVIPTAPFEWVGIVFAVVILGGIGDAVGTLLAGLVVGAVSGLVSVTLSPAAAPLVIFSAVILALLLRPDGVFARRPA
ncbi:MAG TPA: branched-chain amino acid ABC transporter permease [Candidatus Limnocylindrales bacterium]|nr:branched-chain amino acid ABC transporter permease [Candidatus Limnocylindrales bacterium]